MANQPEDDLPGHASPQQPHPPTSEAEETIDLGAPPPGHPEPSGLSGEWASIVDAGPLSEVLPRPDNLEDVGTPGEVAGEFAAFEELDPADAEAAAFAEIAEIEASPAVPTEVPVEAGVAEVTEEDLFGEMVEVSAAESAEPVAMVAEEDLFGEVVEVSAADTAEPVAVVAEEDLFGDVVEISAAESAEPVAEVSAAESAEPVAVVAEEDLFGDVVEISAAESAEPVAEVSATDSVEEVVEVTDEDLFGDVVEVSAAEPIRAPVEMAQTAPVEAIDEMDMPIEVVEDADAEESVLFAAPSSEGESLFADSAVDTSPAAVGDMDVVQVAETSGVDLSEALPEMTEVVSAPLLVSAESSGVDLAGTELVAAESASNVLDHVALGNDPAVAAIDSGVDLAGLQAEEVPLGEAEVEPLADDAVMEVAEVEVVEAPSSMVELGGRVGAFETDSTRSKPSDGQQEELGFDDQRDLGENDRIALGGEAIDATSAFPDSGAAFEGGESLFGEEEPEAVVEAGAEEDVFEEYDAGTHAPAPAADTFGLEEAEAELPPSETIDELDAQPADRGTGLSGFSEDDVDQPAVDEPVAEEASEEEALEEEPLEETVPAGTRIRETQPVVAPTVPMRPMPSRFAWFGSGVLLTSLLAIVGMAALAATKPEWSRKLFGGTSPSPTNTATQPGTAAAAGALSPDLQKALESKDPDQVRQAYERQLAQSAKGSTDPKDLVRKSQVLAQEAFQKNPTAPLDLSSDEAKTVLGELESVKDKDPAAALQLGRMYELAGKLPEALGVYEAAEKAFADNPNFKTAIRRVNRKMSADDMRGEGPRPAGVDLALLLLLLQEPQQPGQEAGGVFLEALEQAEVGDFKAALENLDRARELHARNRRLNPGKGLNPNTDPDEEIFLFSCDLLRNYFLLQQKLAAAELLDMPRDMKPNAARVQKAAERTREAVDKSIREARAGRKAADALTKVLGDKAEEKIPDAVAALAEIVKAKKDAEESLVEAARRLAKDSAALVGTRTKLDGVVARLEKAEKIEDKDKPAEAVGKVLDDLATAEAAAKKQTEAALAARKEAADLVKVFVPKVIPADKLNDTAFVQNKLAALVAAYDASTEKMNLEKLVSDISTLTNDLNKASKQVMALEAQAKTQAEASRKMLEDQKAAQERALKERDLAAAQTLEKQKQAYEERMKVLRSAGQVLPAWAAALRDPESADAVRLAPLALADADLALAARDPKTEGLALLVRGQALAAQNKLDEARAVLLQAKDKLAGDALYLPQATALLALLEDPVRPLLERVARLQQWPGNEILLLLGSAEKKVADPKKKGLLQAQRSLLLLDRARLTDPAGKLTDNSPDVKEALAEAGAAAQAEVASGYYARGRIYEVLDPVRNSRQIQADYQKASELATDPGEKALYRSAWARMLTLPVLPVPENRKPDDKGASLDPEERLLLARMLVLLTFGPIEEQKARDQAQALLQELEPLPREKLTPTQLEALAEAYRLTGQFNKAYEVQIAILRGRVGPEGVAGLRRLERDLFRARREFTEPRVAEGEFFYSQGVREFFAGEYDLALKSLDAAIGADNSDARYYYYRGLVKLAQDKAAEADADFRLGVPLERISQPSRAEVNRSLERVQDGPRRILDAARARP